jgi:2-keto-4-pentenoate hydratase
VLGGPISALRFLGEEIARRPGAESLAVGEIITTGTLTDTHLVAPGAGWTSEIEGLPPVTGLALEFARAPSVA